MIYLWEREGSNIEQRESTLLLPPNGTSADSNPDSISPPVFHPNPSTSFSSSQPIGDPTTRAAPAYYPPRETHSAPGAASGGVSVRPLRSLEGHADGAVFDVRWAGQGMVSAGEDGAVGVWGVGEDSDGEAE